MKKVDCVRRQPLWMLLGIGDHSSSQRGEIVRRERVRNDQDACVGCAILEATHREGDEVVTVAGDETPAFGGSEPELFLIPQTVAAALVRAQNVTTSSPCQLGDPMRQIFIEVEPHYARSGSVKGYSTLTRPGVQSPSIDRRLSISSG